VLRLRWLRRLLVLRLRLFACRRGTGGAGGAGRLRGRIGLRRGLLLRFGRLRCCWIFFGHKSVS
jgi:hypothetical protein